MITIRAGHHDLNRVAELLGVEGGDARISGISEEHGVTFELNAGSKIGLPLCRKFLPSLSIRIHQLECSDRDVRFELKEISVAGWALPGWTIKTGMRIVRSEWVRQWMAAKKFPLEFNSASQIALLLEQIKKKLPFDFKIVDINFVGNDAVVRLTVAPPPTQKGM